MKESSYSSANRSSHKIDLPSQALHYPSWLKWALIFGFWTTLGIFDATQIYLRMRSEGMVHSFWSILFAELLGCWYGYFIFTVVILWLVKRFPPEVTSLKANLIIHLPVFLLLSTIHAVTVPLATIVFEPYGETSQTSAFTQKMWNRWTGEFHLELIVYVMILGGGYAFDYYQRFRERTLRTSQLEAQLAVAQLEVLKMQLHPHFLFNTLNGISSLVRDKKDKAAVNMIAGLSDLLRHTLQNSGKQEVSLKEELDFLELYLDLQQMRFSDRLKIRMNIAPESLEAQVPNLILQPLVENSIRHGIAQRISSGLIEITSWIEGGVLKIKIHDDGPGLPANWQLSESEGIGLSNTRERLQQLYGSEYGFNIQNIREGGTDAVLWLPLRSETVAAPS